MRFLAALAIFAGSVCFGQTRITYRVAFQDQLPGISRSNVESGVDAFARQLQADVNFEFVKVTYVQHAKLYVIIRDVPNNQRAIAIPWGSEGGLYPWPGIYLDSGDNRPWNSDIVRRVVGHEFGHMYWWDHSQNTNDLMHSNASASWFSPVEMRRWIGIFGAAPVRLVRHNADMPADVDGDGGVDFKDVRIVLWFLDRVAMGPQYDREMQGEAWRSVPLRNTYKPDVDGDGVIKSMDAEKVVKELLGL